jgi:hypothetical protein
MNELAPHRLPRSRRASLRLVEHDERCPREDRAERAGTASEAGDRHVLIVGDDETRRSKMVSELRGLLPSGTRFVEAGETWEALAHTDGSRMVVLTGGIGEVSTHSLMRILSRRHPMLPVIAVGERTRNLDSPRRAGLAPA